MTPLLNCIMHRDGIYWQLTIMACLRKFDPDIYHRKSIRLKGYDYTLPGAYYITLCIHDRDEELFGMVENGVMILNEFGRILEKTWFELPNQNPRVSLDSHVIMPDHFHGIIVIRDNPSVRAGYEPAPTLMIQPAGTGCDPTGAGYEPAPTPMIQPVGTGCDPTGAGYEPAPTKYHGLPEIVRQFKSFSARRINESRKSPGIPVWQRNYYEHIIRPGEIERIRQYIRDNPQNYITD